MDTKVGSLKVPPASLLVFPILFIIILALYDHLIIPFARKATKTEMGISHLQQLVPGGFAVLVSWFKLVHLGRFLEFFFTEAPARIRSLAMAIVMGFIGNGVLPHFSSCFGSQHITKTSKNTPWLSGSNLNHYHLGGSLG
ncbi:hypothetical protein IFM89_033389 [Coptis chinensis]|uniref:Uncharacterized protein n=1 Tax=Coptis chinensis TaxID=261450 RepID=A0A835HIN8_9MAGN|nr:hypothetical protein IFM89_033389 [Coptis chinensis]